MSDVMRNKIKLRSFKSSEHVNEKGGGPYQHFAYAKTNVQTSFSVTVTVISAFVFATRTAQFLYFLYPKFSASSHLLCLYSSVCVGPVRKPHCWFSHDVAHILVAMLLTIQRMNHPTTFTNVYLNITKTCPCNIQCTEIFSVVKVENLI